MVLEVLPTVDLTKKHVQILNLEKEIEQVGLIRENTITFDQRHLWSVVGTWSVVENLGFLS